ncbi:MAG: protease modulator HflC [Geminicoccaceae bacterium]
MNRALIALVVVGALVLLGIFSSLFRVYETQQALVLQFGEYIKTATEPGLHFKIPLLQNVVFIDRRVLDFDAPAQEVILGDQKRLVVDAFVRYRITNAQLFYQAVQNEDGLRRRIDSGLDASLREVLGRTPLFSVLSADRASLMQRIRDDTNSRVKSFGVDVVDVRIKRADLPPENSEAIYRRMQTEREREAKELRAQGYELGQRIRASADRERRVIIAEAQKKSEIIRGRGDGESTRIYAEAYGQNIDFFSFYRSMQAYKGALADDNTSFVLSPDGEFFRFFGSSTLDLPQEARSGDGPRTTGSSSNDDLNQALGQLLKPAEPATVQ